MKLWQKLTDLFDEVGVAQEMGKRYKDTILCIEAKGKKYYAHYRGLEDNFHKFRDSSNNIISLSVNTEYDVFVPRVESGCYNTHRGVVHVSPIPARQWKRGLTKGNTVVVNLMNTLVGMIQVNSFDHVIHDVLDDNKQAECTVDVAIAKAQQYGSYACNRTFSVMVNPTLDTDECLLFYQRCLVAAITANQIRIINPVFTQEILDSQRLLFANYEVS